MEQEAKYEWLIMVYSLPPKAGSNRVKVWRQLKKLGAEILRNSVYILPFGQERYEICQWLCQEIQRAEGEATLLKVDKIENLSNEEIVASFRRARNEEYAKLAGEGETWLEKLKSTSQEKALALADELKVLEKQLVRLREIDYFHANGYKEVKSVLRQCRTALRELWGEERMPTLEKSKLLKPEKFSKRTWVTRPRPHIDRIATAWLILRFIDSEAKFVFADDYKNVKGGIPFDYPEVEFGHHGEDCTFETFLKNFGLTDSALKEIAEIVHDIDLKDDKFGRDEARGVDATIKGLAAVIADDQDLLSQSFILFDGLYAGFKGTSM
ncbi:MAG TPA: chromate resistance protein ChrB domain-containing protein [Thermodesulfobacteriota bacterium]|nr:chromate resistance protein ChrB domain-containing protein [Thermodesulfobacteriota bacterium]